ncbi:MAG TPA: hypothetical protein EYH06_12895 [Chromatiales bacterium]|nr:hypothetical protein [Chromatiales bacterium]
MNKTLEQWQQENQGVAETLVTNPKDLAEATYVETVRWGRYYLLPDGTRVLARHDVRGNYMYTDIPENDRTQPTTWQSTTWLNQRFRKSFKNEKVFIGLEKREKSIIDSDTGEIIARSIDYVSPILFPSSTPTLRDYKIWLAIDSCYREKDRETKWLVEGDSFISLKKKFKNLKGDNQ